MALSPASSFTIYSGDKSFQVHQKRSGEAAQIDKNNDSRLDDAEILSYLEKNDDLCGHVSGEQHDHSRILADYKNHLQGKMPESLSAYKSYDQLSAQMDDLVKQYPDKALKVSLGKTHEGRDIWALKVSKDVNSDSTQERPGVVVTGVHHAREWATSLVPLTIATETLENYSSDPAAKKRIDGGELWFVPVANPDGFEYSRTENSWWRKNRSPQLVNPCGEKITRETYGVDINRNYADGKPEHAHIYRPKGDSPCSTRDDGRATSDNPQSDTYRGRSGASEIEVQSLLNLELGRSNMKGVLDYHSYGGMILYPWGNTREEVENADTYRAVGTRMNDAIGTGKYRLMQSVSLYPTSGGSHDIHHANGLFSITMEIGNSFHPRESELPDIVGKATRAGKVFIDDVLAMNTTAAEA
ncbi:MAG: M14 family zinc carboxypeptidase [Vulcanimicrobiota bacterium]